MSARLRVIEDAERFAERAADELAALILHAARRPGNVSVALAGGATPAAVYRELARRALPWERIELYFGDERCVPPGDARSNWRMASESLLALLPPPGPAAVHRIEGEDPDPAAAAARYERLLPERLDLVLLGIGADGHTASVFADSPTFELGAQRVAAVRAPKPPPGRITLTPRALAAARALVVLASGVDKRMAVARALEGPLDPRAVPAQLAREGTWLLDADAAAGLARETR